MGKDLTYCENVDADIPKLFIDKEIGGKDEDGQPNIQGNEFLKELLFISDELHKSKVEVWINSPGGVVTEGQSIYASILSSVASVDTVCYGIAASISGVIFQAGRKRKMYDYATLMYHPAYSEDGKVDKGLEALNNAICKMIATRTGKTEDEIWAIMNRGKADDKGTWIGADEALAMGFCDEVIRSDSKNKNAIVTESTNALWKEANKVLNRNNKPTKKNMKNVLNKLGLVEDANEASAIAAIDALNKSMDDLKKQYDKKKAELEDLKKEMDEMKAKKKAEDEDAEKKAKADADEKAKAEEEAKNKKAEEDKKKADEECKNAVAAGKIKNDAKVIESFKNAFLRDYEGTKAIIDAMPATKTSPVFVTAETNSIQDSEAEQSARRAGIKVGSANWYNHIKAFELNKRK